MLLNEEVIEQVMKNSILINFNQISNIANQNSRDHFSLSNSNNNNYNNNNNFNNHISNSSNNKYQSQKNSQDQVSNSKIGKINKSSLNNNNNNNSTTNLNNNNNIFIIDNNLTNLNKSSTSISNSLLNNQSLNNNNHNNHEFNRQSPLGQSNTLNHSAHLKMNSNFTNSFNNVSSNMSNKIEINNPNSNLNNINNFNMQTASDNIHCNNSGLFDYVDNININNKNKNASSGFKKAKDPAFENLNEEKNNFLDSNEIENNLNSNNNFKLNNLNNHTTNENSGLPHNNNYFSETNSAKFDKSELTDEVDFSSLNKSINSNAKAELNKINNSKEKAIFISEVFETQMQLESSSRLKKLFEIYNCVNKSFSFELKDLIDLLKKFSLVSPNLNSNESFNFNNTYAAAFQKDSGCKSENLLHDYNKNNCSNMFSSSLSLKTTFIVDNNNNLNNKNNLVNNLKPAYCNINDYLPLGFDLLKYFNDKETSDLKIIVGDYIFYAHKVIIIKKICFYNNNFLQKILIYSNVLIKI